MVGEFSFGSYRRIIILAGVTTGHAALLIWALSLRIAPYQVAPHDSLQLTFAERDIVPIREIVTPPPPDPVPPAPIKTPAPPKVDTVSIDPPPAPIVASPTPTETRIETATTEPPSDGLDVLTQVEVWDGGLHATTTPSIDMSTVIHADEIALVLRRAACAQLRRARDETCPRDDVFAAIEARTADAKHPFTILPDLPLNAMEQFLARQEAPGHMFPGMSADLFDNPMPSGAYDAQRIRNGQEPLWSKETRDSFRIED